MKNQDNLEMFVFYRYLLGLQDTHLKIGTIQDEPGPVVTVVTKEP